MENRKIIQHLKQDLGTSGKTGLRYIRDENGCKGALLPNRRREGGEAGRAAVRRRGQWGTLEEIDTGAAAAMQLLPCPCRGITGLAATPNPLVSRFNTIAKTLDTSQVPAAIMLGE